MKNKFPEEKKEWGKKKNKAANPPCQTPLPHPDTKTRRSKVLRPIQIQPSMPFAESMSPCLQAIKENRCFAAKYEGLRVDIPLQCLVKVRNLSSSGGMNGLPFKTAAITMTCVPNQKGVAIWKCLASVFRTQGSIKPR